jgi:hypothetical protein
MMKVKIKTSNNVNLSIPVPYTLLKAGSSILGSKRFHQQLHKWVNHDHDNKHSIKMIPFQTILNKQLMKAIIKDISHYKGLVLVDIKTHDGTEVTVRL